MSLENKNLIDLEGLKHYDEKIKEYIKESATLIIEDSNFPYDGLSIETFDTIINSDFGFIAIHNDPYYGVVINKSVKDEDDYAPIAQKHISVFVAQVQFIYTKDENGSITVNMAGTITSIVDGNFPASIEKKTWDKAFNSLPCIIVDDMAVNIGLVLGYKMSTISVLLQNKLYEYNLNLIDDSELIPAKISSFVVDSELSFESENPIQNKVVTEALDGKVSKITTPSTGYVRVYAHNTNGDDIAMNIDDGLAGVWRLAQYMSNTSGNNKPSSGRLLQREPELPYQVANKLYVDTIAEDKLDKDIIPSAKSSIRQVLVINTIEDGGGVSARDAANYVLNNAFVQRTSTGQIAVPLTPGTGGNATSKKYVDEAITPLTSKTAEMQRDISDLYLLSNATVTGTEELTQEYSERQTADGLSGLIDGALTRVTKVQGNTVKSANILPFPYAATTTTINGVTFTVKDNGSITLNGTATETASFRVYIGYNSKNFLTVGKTYTLYLENTPSVSSIYIHCYYSLIGEAGFKKLISTLDGNPISGAMVENVNNLYIDLIVLPAAGTLSNVTVYPMIVEGSYTESTIPKYTPYFTGLKNSYFKGVISTGKNLFDALGETTTTATKYNYAVGSITNNNVAPGATDRVFYSRIYPAGTYTISGLVTSTSQDGEADSQFSVLVKCDSKPSGFEYIDYYKAYVANMDSGVKKSFTTTKPFIIGIRFNGTANSKKTYSDIMLQYGKTPTEYEPYKTDESFMLENAVELGLGVTIDVQNKKIIDNSKTVVLTGEEAWHTGSLYLDKYSSLFCYDILPTSQRRAEGVATVGRVAKSTNDIQEYGYGVWWCGVNNDELYILGAEQYFNLTQFADPNNPTEEEKATLLAEWKAYLAQQYANGNPVTIRYVSTTGTETDIEIPTDKYQAWVGGTETQIQGDINNSEYGANNTITQTYAVIKGGAE